MACLALDREHEKGLAGRWKTALYRNSLLELPEKLALWGRHMDYRTFPDNTPEQVEALVTNLQALAYRIKELVEVCAYPQADLLVRELADDLRAWRMLAERQFGLYACEPDRATRQIADPQARAEGRLARLESRIEEIFRKAGKGQLCDADYEISIVISAPSGACRKPDSPMCGLPIK